MSITAKQNLLYGKSMKDSSNDSKLLYFNAIELADPSGLFDVSHVLDAYNIPLTALMELVDAKLLLYFEDENVAVIVHWNTVANRFQKGPSTLFPEVRKRLVIRNGKYQRKEKAESTEFFYDA